MEKPLGQGFVVGYVLSFLFRSDILVDLRVAYQLPSGNYFKYIYTGSLFNDFVF